MKRNVLHQQALALLLSVFVLTGCAPAVSQPGRTTLRAIAPMELVTPSPLTCREQGLATLFAAAYLDQDAYLRHDKLFLHWPADLDVSGELVIRIQKPDGWIYLERHFLATAAAVARLDKAYQLPAGSYFIVLIPSLNEYYLGNLRLTRKLAIQVCNGEQQAPSPIGYGDDVRNAR